MLIPLPRPLGVPRSPLPLRAREVPHLLLAKPDEAVGFRPPRAEGLGAALYRIRRRSALLRLRLRAATRREEAEREVHSADRSGHGCCGWEPITV